MLEYIFFSATLWEEPVFIGVITPLLSAGVLLVIKKTYDILNTVGKMAEGQEHFREAIAEIMSKQDVMDSKLTTVTNELRYHMKGEESVVDDILGEIKGLKYQLDEHSLQLARTAFRQAAVHSDQAFYDTKLVDGEWEFQWGNKAYYELSGLSLPEAKADLFWEVNVAEDHRDRFQRTLVEQASRGEVIDVDYKFLTPGKGCRCVNLSAVPVLNVDGQPIAYFGAIKVLGPEEVCDE